VNIIQHEHIKFRLRSKGVTFADLARELGVHRTQITAVLKGRITSARIQNAIAEALGDSVEDLFPDRRCA
jgi:lambda repressor-like predicted transcriptional regulator